MAYKVTSLRGKRIASLSEHFSRELPLWCKPCYASYLKNPVMLLAHKGEKLAAVWLVPSTNTGGSLSYEREPRLFPYTSPTILEKGNSNRRSVMQALFRHLTKSAYAIELPMCPDFFDITGAIEEGAFAEWRHTYRCDLALRSSMVSPPWGTRGKLAGHIRKATQWARVESCSSVDDFRFDLAIKTGSPEHLSARVALARELFSNGNAVAFRCIEASCVVGEAFGCDQPNSDQCCCCCPLVERRCTVAPPPGYVLGHVTSPEFWGT